MGGHVRTMRVNRDEWEARRGSSPNGNDRNRQTLPTPSTTAAPPPPVLPTTVCHSSYHSRWGRRGGRQAAANDKAVVGCATRPPFLTPLY